MHDEETRRTLAARRLLRLRAKGESGEDGDLVTLTEAARRLGVGVGGLSRKVKKLDLPTRRVENRLLISWSRLSAAYPPPGFVTIADVAAREGIVAQSLYSRCAKRGIDIHSFASHETVGYVRVEDVPALLAPHESPVDPTGTAKRCSVCGEVKPLSEFGPRADGAAGTMAHCRACHRPIGRKEYAAWRARRRERAGNREETRVVSRPRAASTDRLTRRQIEVLRRLCAGETPAEIARADGVTARSIRTIRVHAMKRVPAGVTFAEVCRDLAGHEPPAGSANRSGAVPTGS